VFEVLNFYCPLFKVKQMNNQSYLIIKNGTVITPGREIGDGVVIVKGEKIIEVGKRGEVEEPVNAEIIDANKATISPGLIDIHVNGAMGADVTKVAPDTFPVMGNFFVKHGTTSYLGTAITSGDSDFIKVLEHAREYIRRGKIDGAELLGIHMEGPYLSHAQSGAHPHEFLSLPKPGHYLQFLEYSDVLKKMTLAPELEGAGQLVKDLKSRGIIAAAGHTDGIYPEMSAAINAGITHATHFFCNMSHFRRHGLKRVAGVVETLLYDSRVTGEIIADGWHVGPQLMKLLVKVKGVENVCFVTDAMQAAGLPDGLHFIGDVEAIVENGVARLKDNSAYAGSVTTMDVCVRNGLSQVGLSLVDAIRMSSLTPAKIIGADNRKGSLEKGKDADITIFDKGINVTRTICKGEIMF
jgi:N-acetylglucosamine-6-phosphate deacetylase